MTAYQPLIGVRFPANIMKHIQIVKPIAMFDIMDGLEGTEYELGD